MKQTRQPAIPAISFRIPRSKAKPGFRDSGHVTQVVLRIGKPHHRALETLADINEISSREVVERLIKEAYNDLRDHPSERLES